MKGLDSGTEAKKSFTLSQLTESLRTQIDRIYRKPYWIKAEINRLNHYPQSGHCYPELVEKREGKIIAQIRGLIFRNTYARIELNFKNHTGKALSDGMEVMLLCRVKFDSKYGISVFVEDIDPAYTLGEMARARSLAIARLKKEGIFELNQGLYLPKLLRHLAVISVATSKGWRDFTETIDDSLYSGLISRRLFPAKLQGDEAVESIGKALKEIRSKADQFDAVAIIRGGGGETGMDCYDNFALAKQVATFPLPVLTGIGHSTNLTVVEMCSRRNLITPTALAGFIVNEFADFDNRIHTAARTLMRIGKHFLPLLENRLEGLAEKLERTARQRIGSSEEELLRLGRRMEKSAGAAVEFEKGRLEYRIPNLLESILRRVLENRASSLAQARLKLERLAMSLTEAEAVRLAHLEEKMRILDPVNVLKRGFSITTLYGKALTSTDEVEIGDEMETRLANGKLISKVKSKRNGR